MRSALAILLVLVSTCLYAEDSKRDEKYATFVEKGLFSIRLPNGYSWANSAYWWKGEPWAERQYHLYYYKGKGKPSAGLKLSVCVIVFDIVTDSQERKKQQLDYYIKDSCESFTASDDDEEEITVVDIRKPDRLAERARCSLTVKHSKRGEIHSESIIFFGKNTFIIEVNGRSKEKTEQMLLETEKEFKILGTIKHSRKTPEKRPVSGSLGK